MNRSINYLLLFTSLLFFIACNSKKEQTPKTKYDPCINGHDTTFHLRFSLDTSTQDFYQLLNFIESKKEFTGLNRKHKIDSSTNNVVALKRLLCEQKYFDSPIEYWFLDNIFSISYFLTSPTPAKGTKDFFPSFRITQLNFISQVELDSAAKKILEIRWGEPLHKWNDWYFVKGKKRIYILECYVAMFSETTKKYQNIIQKEWAEQNIR